VGDFAEHARKQLAEATTTPEVVERAVRICGQLTHHLSRIIGEIGVTSLMRRSIAIAGTEFPCLHTTPSAGHAACPDLRVALESQPPGLAADAFLAVLTTFIGLLKRLIGDGLVDRLLDEVWRATFQVSTP
jgi:hypothetical protein